MPQTGSAVSNGVRQYAVTVPSANWAQLESRAITAAAVPASGLAPSMPVRRWTGQAGPQPAGNAVGYPYDYPQGGAIQNRDAAANLYITTTPEPDSGTAPTRNIAYAIKVPPGGVFRLDATDLSKVWLRCDGAGTIVAAVIGN